jgi:hypothetical protein
MEIIYSLQELKGTCYFGILPGKYLGECWIEGSIFIDDIQFTFLEPVIAKSYSKFDHYGFNEINSDVWKEILNDFAEFSELIKSFDEKKIENYIKGYFKNSTNHFVTEYQSKSAEIIKFIAEFTNWIEEKSKSFEYISVLGI